LQNQEYYKLKKIMKKIYMFMALLLVSGVMFAQAQRVKKADKSKLSAVKVIKEINATTTSGAKAVVDSLNYDGAPSTAIGTNTTASNFGVYAFFPASTLAPHATASHYILSVKVYIGEITTITSSQLRFYSDTLSTAMVYSQAFTPVLGWNNVVLTSPLAVPSTGNLYIGYYLNTTGGFPASLDTLVTNANGNWMDFSGWTHLSDITSITGVWNIRAMCGTLPTSPVASCTPLSWAAGNVPTSTSVTSGSFILSNAGSGTLTCSGISGLSAPYTTTLVPATVSLTTGATKTFTFTYNPTAVATDNQTVVIATNGGNITINLTGSGVSCSAISSFPWSEGFEGAIFPPTCWSLNDADGDGFNWVQQSAPGFSAHGGTLVAASASWDQVGGPLTPDNFLITPQFNINSSNLVLKYWVAAQDNDFAGEHYSVMVSTSGILPANFTEVFNETLTDSAWHQIEVPLASYNTQNIYIAFRHWNITDMFNMKLDDISIDLGVGINNPKENSVSVFPNPANNKLNIIADNIKSVEIYNLIGQNVATFGNVHLINTSDLSIGSYLVKVITDSKVITQKINITH